MDIWLSAGQGWDGPRQKDAAIVICNFAKDEFKDRYKYKDIYKDNYEHKDRNKYKDKFKVRYKDDYEHDDRQMQKKWWNGYWQREAASDFVGVISNCAKDKYKYKNKENDKYR